jgi:Glycosyl transferases group 1
MGADPVAAFIGARIYRDCDGALTTDSSTLYEVAALAGELGALDIHAFVVEGSARDELRLPTGTRVHSLGDVRDGTSLYLSAAAIAARTLRSCHRRRWRAAVIFETGLVPLMALASCALTGTPTVAAVRGDPGRTAGAAARHRAGAGRAVGRVLRGVHAASRRAAARSVPVVVDCRAVARRVVAGGGEAVVVPAGSISEMAILRTREFWTPGSGRPLRALYVGRLELVKGVDDVVRAVGLARAAGVPVELELVGAGDPAYEAQLRRLAADLGLDGVVRFEGALPHGPRLFERYRAADLLVIGSRSEGMPKVVGEAFAHGVPVIGTSVGGLVDVVGHGLGMLVPHGSPGDLARAIGWYHEDPARLRDDGLRCLERARSLTLEATARDLAAAVGRARPPRWVRERRP